MTNTCDSLNRLSVKVLHDVSRPMSLSGWHHDGSKSVPRPVVILFSMSLFFVRSHLGASRGCLCSVSVAIWVQAGPGRESEEKKRQEAKDKRTRCGTKTLALQQPAQDLNTSVKDGWKNCRCVRDKLLHR